MGNKIIDLKFIEDIIENEDLELYESLEEFDENPLVTENISMVIEELIFEYDFIKETYYRLRVKYSDEEVIELLSQAYLKIVDITLEGYIFDVEKYKIVISELN